MAVDSKPIVSNSGLKGTQYYLGRSNGWVKDFDNIFFDGVWSDGEDTFVMQGMRIIRR
jgi:hypothetical protein